MNLNEDYLDHYQKKMKDLRSLISEIDGSRV